MSVCLHYPAYSAHNFVLTQYIISTRTSFTSGKDSRVHESGHAEVGQGEDEHNSIVDGNDRWEVLR